MATTDQEILSQLDQLNKSMQILQKNYDELKTDFKSMPDIIKRVFEDQFRGFQSTQNMKFDDLQSLVEQSINAIKSIAGKI